MDDVKRKVMEEIFDLFSKGKGPKKVSVVAVGKPQDEDQAEQYAEDDSSPLDLLKSKETHDKCPHCGCDL